MKKSQSLDETQTQRITRPMPKLHDDVHTLRLNSHAYSNIQAELLSVVL